MLTNTDAPTIMTQLKESTQAQHDSTENGEFNKELVQGRLPVNAYIDSLGQLFLVHSRLESHLRTFLPNVPAIAAVVRDYQFQEPYLREDLKHFGRDPSEFRPLPATSAFLNEIDRLAAECPVALLGVQYVFEGSNNGSKHISRAIRRAYNLPGTDGTRYLDPYGDKQREYWQAFKDDMNAQSFSADEARAIVATASATFNAVMNLHRELGASCGTSPTAGAAPRCPAHRAPA